MGFVHVYTGNGKGKTSAALGLALRALGHGMRVYIAQFLKGMDYGELHSLKRFENVTLERFGRPKFIHGKPDEEDVRLAMEGLNRCREVVSSGEYDIVIMDEANIAVFLGLFSVQDLLEVVAKRHERTEVVITGRYAPEELIDVADLVTEMVEIKHYYSKGVQARKGIEY
ncbi:cob(I)yrinic acid a,c-diamide adenosyltransferase [Thermotoga sp. Ku-13t]|uniref:cob(I)yrinic acid a,c-diamide adenosyltransferase n=1 Tax=Thermotoga sp. Ku-13t TaxID=1755813 RepID=UPI0013EBA4EB|nr:cob(I)yrinic acid a,c-diamide adenosyltransferase [Thermotoga sp. Ku-13t]KAF2957569.1 cob(I)yrinic acid a,c-diamide adenosyltransferase [Thermotoga sp. Ku-13t]